MKKINDIMKQFKAAVKCFEAISNTSAQSKKGAKINNCKGIVYRASTWVGITDRGLTSYVRLREMKSLSCSGCEKCYWMREELREFEGHDFAGDGRSKA